MAIDAPRYACIDSGFRTAYTRPQTVRTITSPIAGGRIVDNQQPHWPSTFNTDCRSRKSCITLYLAVLSLLHYANIARPTSVPHTTSACSTRYGLTPRCGIAYWYLQARIADPQFPSRILFTDEVTFPGMVTSTDTICMLRRM